MVERYSFIPVFTCIMGGLAYWSGEVGPAKVGLPEVGRNLASITGRVELSEKQGLVEFLDGLVSREHAYYAKNGTYCSQIKKLGLEIPSGLAQKYFISVTVASPSSLIVTATQNSVQDHGAEANRLTINQHFQVESNFVLPAPRMEYLRSQALRHMIDLHGDPKGGAELGVYRGYFKYLVDRGGLSAMGVRPPVLGVFLQPQEALAAEIADQATSVQWGSGLLSSSSGVSRRSDASSLKRESIQTRSVASSANTKKGKIQIQSFVDLDQIAHTRRSLSKSPGGLANVEGQSLRRHSLKAEPIKGLQIDRIAGE